jgi:hypothetical protein
MSGLGEEFARGFAVVFALLVGFGVRLEQVCEARFGEGFGFGVEELLAFGRDAGDRFDGGLIGLGLEDGGELLEGEAVELAELE